MTKNILTLLIVLTTCSVVTLGFTNWNDSSSCESTLPSPIINKMDIDLVYNVDSRFIATISKEDLHRATSIIDIVPEEANWSEIPFQKVTITVHETEHDDPAIGDSRVLNYDQMRLIQSIDYSTDFHIDARGEEGHPTRGRVVDYAYYITVVPEQEAEYIGGQDALISYLRENSKEETAAIRQDKLKAGRVSFIITKDGDVDNVLIDASSGYWGIDQSLVQLVKNTSGKWQPATNSKGEQVEQKLIFFFGRQGC